MTDGEIHTEEVHSTQSEISFHQTPRTTQPYLRLSILYLPTCLPSGRASIDSTTRSTKSMEKSKIVVVIIESPELMIQSLQLDLMR